MTERELQASITDAAQRLGWLTYHTHDSRRSAHGFPDLVLVRGNTVLFLELKSGKGRVSPDQQTWQARLSQACQVGAAVVRPADYDRLLSELQRIGYIPPVPHGEPVLRVASLRAATIR